MRHWGQKKWKMVRKIFLDIWNIFLEIWIDGYWEHILGYLDIWKRFLAGGKIILDVWTDMEISVTGSDAGKVPTLSFTSEDLIARLHSISFHMIF